MNAVVRQWNDATRSQRTGELDTAANAMGTTATQLRGIGKSSGDSGFTTRVNKVADELAAMNKARDDGKSVLTTNYNTAARALRSYCSTTIGK
ncbi:hypothetical protein VV02_04715 [Luteipulveratus mongoliensis]|uniref:Uncharacterized protein n=2 Tax=Luteipulveratus mongoliensis TaxID=571913 RepID=A0A0K1JF31_9MICO|nr:hypothetical protein VV02_04715 [Luteipulveratus mongoliensis]